jgi:DNA-binding NarL/FixJ family response regulator
VPYATQFDVWGLTDAEADVAGLLLKGMAHKEIALLRGSSEATVRQHAAAVYRKSGLTSRAQLTAFFLEDLLAPSENADHRDRLRVVKDES